VIAANSITRGDIEIIKVVESLDDLAIDLSNGICTKPQVAELELYA
jgi:hypothetical protein